MEEKAILLANLGSPNSTNVKDVRAYLGEFLMDERVIDLPLFWRALLVKGIIVPFRAPQSAKKYASIWTDKGSPLVAISKEQAALLEEKMHLPVYLCMRYANPTPRAVLEKIRKNHSQLKELTVLPLYPHYAMSSYETAVAYIKQSYAAGNYAFQIKFVQPFYNNPSYIKNLCDTIKIIKQPYEHILFSYHGIPERHVKKTDPTKSHCLSSTDCCDTASAAHALCYRHQVMTTTRLVAKQLNLPIEKYTVSFQSRLGRDKWLSPSTVETLKTLPAKGVRNLLVVSPAFVSDCLETLEELHKEGKEIFQHHGGLDFTVAPCLNTDNAWIETMQKLIQETE